MDDDEEENGEDEEGEEEEEDSIVIPLLGQLINKFIKLRNKFCVGL